VRNRNRWMRSLAESDPVTRARRVLPLKTYFTGASCSRTSKCLPT